MKAPKKYKGGGTTGDDKPKTTKTLAKAKDVNQTIARQYDLSKMPSYTERNAWNKFLTWVEKDKGYADSKALELNKGENQFNNLINEYSNPDILGKSYDELAAKLALEKKTMPINRENYIKARQVTPEMLKNAQGFYKQQTSQDNWFGSETGQTYYPTISGAAMSYDNVSNPNISTKIRDVNNGSKYAPLEIKDFKSGKSVPFKGIAPVKYGDDGKPIIDYKGAREYAPADSANMYIDPEMIKKNPSFQEYLTPSTTVTPTALPATPGLKKGGKITKAPKRFATGGTVYDEDGNPIDPAKLAAQQNLAEEQKKQDFNQGYLDKTLATASDPATMAAIKSGDKAAMANIGIGLGADITKQYAQGREMELYNTDSEVSDKKAKNVSGLSAAATGAKMGAKVGLNPELLAATGGLSALAVPAGAGLGYALGRAQGSKKADAFNYGIRDAKAKKLQGEQQDAYEMTLNRQLTQRQEGYANGGMIGTATNVDGDLLTEEELNASMGYVPDAGNVEKQRFGLPEFGGDTSRIGLTASFKKGGYVHGPGTGTSDSVKAKVEPGSFITPAKNAKVAEKVLEHVSGGKVTKAPSMKKKADLNQAGGEEVRLSKGEFVFTPEQREEIISELGEDVLEALAPDAEHGEDEMKKGGLTAAKAKIILHDGTIRGKAITDKQRKYFGAISNGYECGGKVDKMADGGVVKKKGQKLVDNGEEVTFDGKYWVSKDGSKKIRADYYDSYLKKESEKAAKEDAKYKTYMADAIKRQSKLPETKMVSKTGPEIEAATANKGKVSIAPKIGKKTSAAKETADKLTAKSPVEKMTMTDTEVITPKSLATTETVTEDVTGNKRPSNDALLKAGLGLGKQIGGLANYVIPYKQTQLGRKLLAESGKRPVDKIDPDFQAAVNKAQANAKFGYTPEEQALIDQRNISALRSGENAAKNYSGGSASNALSLQRQAANDYFSRGLQSAIASKNLQMDKQSQANEMINQKAAMNRQLFGDTMNAWQQNQVAGGNLVGAGIQNLIGAKRLNDQMNFERQYAQGNNPWTQQGGFKNNLSAG